MLSLYLNLYFPIKFFFFWLYILGVQIMVFLSFYPLGFFLAVLIIYWLIFIVYKLIVIFRTYVKTFEYWGIGEIYNFFFFFKFFYLFLTNTSKLLNNLIYFFANYYYVFYVKKTYFYLVWFFIIFSLIN